MVCLQGAGAFSSDFTTNLAPQSRAFSGALKIEKLKAPLFSGPRGAEDTNDWCTTCALDTLGVCFVRVWAQTFFKHA